MRNDVEGEERSHRTQPADPEPHTREEARGLLDAAMDERYALCPDDPMTPEDLEDLCDDYRRRVLAGQVGGCALCGGPMGDEPGDAHATCVAHKAVEADRAGPATPGGPSG